MQPAFTDILKITSKTRVIIPSKCGTFAQSSVVSKMNKGVPKDDILMGICRGLVGNYFTMLAKGVKLQSPYIFQGATAKNKALVKCFEEELKNKTSSSFKVPYCLNKNNQAFL